LKTPTPSVSKQDSCSGKQIADFAV